MEYKFNELPDWGPGLDQYAKTFHKRLCLSFENYVANKETTIDAPKNLIPLSLLETTLAAGENMHKIGFQRGGKLFPVLISTLRKYTELHRGTLFDNYYGFLCIRHLIRMVCIATLTKVKSFDRFMKSLTQGMSSHEVTDLLSGNALEAMAEALYTSDLYNVAKLLGCISSSGKAFPGDGGLTFKDVEFLIDILWEGRFWMVKLRRAGLLPGLPALIFVLCEMTIFSKRSPYKTPWAHIQELLFRSYLGDTTYSERALLRQLCRYTDHQIAEYELPQEYIAINEDDALDVITAYIDLLSPPLELELAPIMLLDISIMLFRYIYSLMTNGQRKMILEEMAPAIVRSALARLGLEIDREWDGTMQAPRRGFTREYAADVFGHMGIIEEQIVSYKVRQAYAQMVLEVDLYGLAGRVLLLITRETIDDPPEWRLLLSSFSRLQQIIENLPFPAALLDDVAHDWRKMFVYMAYNILAIPSTTPVTCLQEAFEAWLSLKPLTVKPQVGRFECEYPRCAVRFAQLRVPEAKISCEDCRSVSYCSARCQQMHWVMDIPDSHSLDCRPG